MKKILLLLGIIAASALAQEQGVNLEKSIITSTTGFQEKLSKENKNVTIISKEILEEKEYRDIEEVFRDSSNVIVQDTYFGPIIDLRGNGERALSRVKVLIDGIAINPIDEAMGTLPINTIPVNSIERIEVIPGGGAVLNGSGTAGGVVNIITKATERKDYFTLNYGNLSYNTNKTSFSTGYNITDKLYINTGYSHLNGKGYRDGDKKENGNFIGGFDYKLTPNQRISFQGSKFKGNEDTSTSALKTEFDKNRKIAGFPVESHSDRESYSFDYELKINNQLMFLTTLYNQRYQRNFIENSIMNYKMEKIGSMPFNLIGYDLPAQMDGRFDEKSKGAKVRGKYTYDNGEFVLGYDYNKTKLKRVSYISTFGKFYPLIGNKPMLGMGIAADVNIDIFNDIYKETNAIYGLNKYELSKNLNLITGIRYEHSEFGGNRVSKTNVLAPPMPIINTFKSIEDKRDSEDYAGEVGLNYSYSDTGSVFARYERGFISPMPGQITNKNKNMEYTSNSLKSETSDNFEIGFRDFINNNYISWSIFTTFTDNEITLIQGNVHNPATKWWAYENLAKTRRIGTELFSEQYFNKLTLSEGIMYVNTKITSGEFKNEKVPLAPEGKITLRANYQFTNKFNAGVSFNYLGKSTIREFDQNNKTFTSKISGYHFTNLALQYKVNSYFVVSSGINNVFNNKYNYSETKDSALPAPERNYYIAGTLSL